MQLWKRIRLGGGGGGGLGNYDRFGYISALPYMLMWKRIKGFGWGGRVA